MSAGSRSSTVRDATGRPGAGIDLLAAWRPGGFLMERRGEGIVTGGELRRIEVPAGHRQAARAAAVADDALAGLGIEGAVLTGALPFRGDVAACLVIPQRVTVTSISPRELDLGGGRAGPSEAAIEAPPPGPRPAAVPLRWEAEPPAAAYAEAVAEALSRIRAGELEKVVLTRALVAGNPGIHLHALLTELRRRDPECHLFAAPDGDGGAFVGATPETLLRREGDRVVSLPLAGTAARCPDDPGRDREAAEALVRSAKNQHEHAAVVEAVAETLTPHCTKLRVDAEPHLVATATVWHLATAVRGRLRPSAPSALALAAALHPTPAVCGTPADVAGALIARLEPASRGLYSGLVGWVDTRGDGEWAVSLRCALITRALVRIQAGAGIVAESRAEREVEETELKFRTIVEALEACAQSPGRGPG
ncbi:MAG: isochorismate synthase [Candidatus Dormibacteria bacterium]|jgi:isochorismate synthase